MHSRQLSYFLCVYENHGINAAAEQLRISQPALTKSIHKLEAELGVQLFERRPSGVVPTHYADILAYRARLMDIEYRHAVAEIDAVRGGNHGVVRIGAGPAWYSTILPPIIDRFLLDWPDMRVDIKSGVINTLIPELEAGECDIVCTSLDFPDKSNIVKEPILDLKHVVIAGENHPLTGADIAAPADLATYPWITLANDHVGIGRILSYFSTHGCEPPNIAVNSSSLTVLYELVAGKRFLAHIAEHMLDGAAQYGIKPLNISGTFWENPHGIIYRQSESRLPALKRFIDAVRSQVK